MKIERFVCNLLEENCYVVSDSTGQCVIIDPGARVGDETDAVKAYIAGNSLTPVHIVATHAHFDHNMGAAALCREYGLGLELHRKDEPLVAKLPAQMKAFLHRDAKVEVPPVARLLEDGDEIEFGHHSITVIHTPGHSPGSVFLYSADGGFAFSGDTLFYGDIGRTDLEGGSMFQIINSLRHISQLPDITAVYPGHGPATTIGREISTNPYMDR